MTEHIQNIIGRDRTEQSEDCSSTHTDQYSDHCNYDNNTHIKTHLNTLQKQQHTVYGSDLHDSPYVRADKSCYKSALECHRRFLWWNPMRISYDGFQSGIPTMDSKAAEWTCSEFECHRFKDFEQNFWDFRSSHSSLLSQTCSLRLNPSIESYTAIYHQTLDRFLSILTLESIIGIPHWNPS